MMGLKGLLKQIRNDHWGKKKSLCYPDVTQKYFDFLKNQDHPDASFSQLCIGQKRWGKTLLSMAAIDKLMANNKDRMLYLLDAEVLEEEISKEFPNRVVSTDQIANIPNNSIIYFDESLVSLSGKRALTKFSRKVGEALAFTSHKKVIVIGNAQTDGLIKDLRDKAEIIILGRLPLFFLEDARESFIKELADKLHTLPKSKAYIFANSFDLTVKGKLIGDKRKWCSWFTDKISRNMSDRSLDTDKERKIQELKYMSKLIKEIEDKYSDKELLGSKLTKKLKGYYLLEDLNKYIFIDERNLWSDLESILLARANDRKRDTKETENISVSITFKESESFPEFLRRNLKVIDKNLAEMCYFWAKGLSYREIFACLPDVSDHEISVTLKEFRESGVNGNNELRSGFLFERWFAQELDGSKGEIGGQSNDPDYIDENGDLYSLKCYSNIKKSLSFSQHKDFGPAYRLAKKKQCKFTAVLYNPKWDHPMRSKKLDPREDPDNVNFFKSGERG
ncbi:MAG: hypothetical protein GF353_28560 [Candidatus Lokiarchaeota archaeon]|nr:hypothetical protein [Candidatus Lokiarchaeota archaeon]MBD3353955.1 hypothetical protein [Candidatus Lokiarchaeota archaeon]